VEGDERGFRVALVTAELLNPPPGGLDTLAVLAEEDWGVIQLPGSDYSEEVVAPLLEQVAEQVAEQAQEFARHGYRLAVVGSHEGLADVLTRHGVAPLPQLDPASAEALRAFLSGDDE
jgi:hypothetical protein